MFMIIANCIADFTTSYGLPVSLFLAGLVGGFTHCAGMCSPFVLAQVKDGVSLNRLRDGLLIPYHLGRMVTYVTLAILLGSVVNLAFLFSDARVLITAPLLMLAGVLFLVSAFPALGQVFPWAVKFQSVRPFAFIMELAGRFMGSTRIVHRFFLGVILGFMPCGLVVSALMAASTAATPLAAGAAMAAFALGTIPALVLVGFGGTILKHKYPKLSRRFSQGAMALSAFWLFALAGFVITG